MDVLLQREDAYYERHSLINVTSPQDTFISGLMLGDFNADVQMDVLLTHSPVGSQKEPAIAVEVFLGNISSLSLSK